MDFFASGQPVLTGDPSNVEEGTTWLCISSFCIATNKCVPATGCVISAIISYLITYYITMALFLEYIRPFIFY